MRTPYKFKYAERVSEHLGGGKIKAIAKCGSYFQYKVELRKLLNACRREVDRLERKEKKCRIM